MYKKRDARQGSCFAHSMEVKKICFFDVLVAVAVVVKVPKQ